MRKAKLVILFLFLIPAALMAQKSSISVSGIIKEKVSDEALPFVNIVLKNPTDSSFVTGTISKEKGRFTISGVKPGEYLLEVSLIGFNQYQSPLFVGSNSEYLDLGVIAMDERVQQLSEVVVTGQQDAVSGQMDKKIFAAEDNVSQGGGSVLQSMQNLPGITTQDGQIQLRGKRSN